MFNLAISKLTAPTVSVVQDWRSSYDGRLGELIDMSQAVPGYAAHPEMTAALEKAAANPDSAPMAGSRATSSFVMPMRPISAPSTMPAQWRKRFTSRFTFIRTKQYSYR